MKWKVDDNKELPVAVIEDTKDGFGICELEGGGTASREKLEKTAHLIAAAPDLLAALKGDEENCAPNVPMILSQALLGNYEAVKAMLRELCSINAKAIAQAEK